MRLPILPPVNQDAPIAAAEEIVNAFNGCPIHLGGNRARYNIIGNIIHLPRPERFLSRTLFYQAAFHEMAHWGAMPEYEEAAFGFLAEKQWVAEIVAELASLFISSECGIGDIGRSASYISRYHGMWYERQSGVIGKLGEFAATAAGKVLESRGSDG